MVSTAAIVLIGVLLLAMLLGLPIAWSLGLACLSSIIVDGDLPLVVMGQRLFTGADSFSMLAIPAFMVAGEIMSRGGISRRLINFANSMVGSVPGSLALVSIIACTFFAAISGAAVATTAAIGGIMIPEMARRGYPRDFASAVQAVGGTLGPVIPPSIVFIFYGNATNVSIKSLLMSGIVPGIIACCGLCLVGYIIARKRNYPTEHAFRRDVFFQAGKNAFFALLMPVIILGGIYSGIFTPTEAAGVSVVYGIIVSVFIYKEISLRELGGMFQDTAKSAANLLILVISAQVFGWLVAYYDIPLMVSDIISQVATSKFAFLIIVNLLLFIAGMFMEAVAITVIMAPILHPLALEYGVDPVHFGFVVVFMLCIGIATPPFGPCLFVACGISNEPVTRVARQILPFIVMQVIMALVFTFVPTLSTWLPSLGR